MFHRYTLQPYSPKHRYHCPECNHRSRSFSRYIDTETGNHLADHVGRCSRENNCGYHFKPAQYFAAQPASVVHRSWLTDHRQKRQCVKRPIAKPKHHEPLTASHDLIHPHYVNASFRAIDYADNHFVQYLVGLFGFDAANELVGRYRIGNSRRWPGATVFWQLDAQGTVRTGKIMLYNRQTGKRVKEPYNHITWAHRPVGSKEQAVGTEGFAAESDPDHKPANTASCTMPAESFHLQQCLFGEHLLNESPDAVVAIVESEKTAIMASARLPLMVWLAAGSINNLNPSICKVLQHRRVILFPDVNAYEKWQAKARELRLALPGINIKVSALLQQMANAEELKSGVDLGDVVGRGVR